MNIIIAGHGFVGKAVSNALKDLHTLYIVDPAYNSNTVKDFLDADGVIICVGTPTTTEGECDVSAIYDVVKQVPIHIPILIKSTVLPNLVDQLTEDFPDHSICYSPEFLRAVSANQDFLSQRSMIIGGSDPEGFWQDLFRSSLPNCKIFFNCTNAEASMAKYTINSFLALKVAFFNQVYDVCEESGLDYELVRQLVCNDIRIGPSHTAVPGMDGSRGFGGACFPKDTNSFTKYAENLNTPLGILESAVLYNKVIRQ